MTGEILQFFCFVLSISQGVTPFYYYDYHHGDWGILSTLIKETPQTMSSIPCTFRMTEETHSVKTVIEASVYWVMVEHHQHICRWQMVPNQCQLACVSGWVKNFTKKPVCCRWQHSQSRTSLAWRTSSAMCGNGHKTGGRRSTPLTSRTTRWVLVTDFTPFCSHPCTYSQVM